MGGPWEHNRWRWAYAYGACWWAPAPPEDCDHWSPDLQARAFAAADDEEHSKWNYVYAYSARGEALSLTPDLDHWSPDLADRADAWACARADEELQALYEEQLADYQRQMEYACYMEEARRRAQEADLERQTAPWGQRWY